MIKNGKILVLTLFFLFSLACTKQKNKAENISHKKLLTNSENTYSNNTRPGYYLQINNQNCHYELNTNDMRSAEYYGNHPVYSVRVPLNLQIYRSGDQQLSLTIFPYSSNLLSEKANLQVRLMMHPNMTDIENDFGGSTTLMEWKMPDVGNQKLPFIKFDTVFKAEVPFEITTLDKRATDLSKMDKAELLEQVVKKFKQTRKAIINKTQDKEELRRAIKRALIQIYEDDKLGEETIQGMINLGDGKEPQPLENFEMRLYYNNRVVTLVKRDDKEPAIWFKNTETGARSWQPVYLYKDVTTGKWMRW